MTPTLLPLQMSWNTKMPPEHCVLLPGPVFSTWSPQISLDLSMDLSPFCRLAGLQPLSQIFQFILIPISQGIIPYVFSTLNLQSFWKTTLVWLLFLWELWHYILGLTFHLPQLRPPSIKDMWRYHWAYLWEDCSPCVYNIAESSASGQMYVLYLSFHKSQQLWNMDIFIDQNRLWPFAWAMVKHYLNFQITKGRVR